MTSQPEVPGAAAVYLDREESTDDILHVRTIYARLKVLTEKGKQYGNVEINYDRGAFTISGISGRTIHSDGTIIPFKGKPYDKLLVKGQGIKYQAKVFTMPDVQVGSILEYRFTIRYSDHVVASPYWHIQTELYLREGHFHFRPTYGPDVPEIAWMPILPPGTSVVRKQKNLDGLWLDLDVKNIPPMPDEEYMPPVSSRSYRVIFYYTPYKSMEEFWKSEGQYWSKNADKFMKPGPEVQRAVQKLISPSDTQDQKLRKIYAAVMQLDNTDFSREHSAEEDKAGGFKAISTAKDVLERKQGDSSEITRLFVSMARSAGMKAYLMTLTSRDNDLFNPHLLRWDQMDDEIAIVNVDGKDEYFDPGERDCPYGEMHWKDTGAAGVRQTDGDPVMASTPVPSYIKSQTHRIADLTMDVAGNVTGVVEMTYIGAPALYWRQELLRGDETSLDHDLEKRVKQLLPDTMRLKLQSVSNLNDYEKPLVVLFQASGSIATATSKRLFVPAQLFEANSKPVFVHDKRNTPVYFDYTSETMDAIRIKFPANVSVESVPKPDKFQLAQLAVMSVTSQTGPGFILMNRTFARNSILFYTKEYPQLREFYAKLASKDQEPAIFKVVQNATGN
ncbi:MAG: DUF3857 domain-containing protein [Acidobacteriaceae bacterium]